jgi:hypothetical protein
MLDSDLDLVYVGNETDLVMFEGSGKEMHEDDFNAALSSRTSNTTNDCFTERVARARWQNQSVRSLLHCA